MNYIQAVHYSMSMHQKVFLLWHWNKKKIVLSPFHDNCHGQFALKLHKCWTLYTAFNFPLEKNGVTVIRKEMTGRSDCKLVLNLRTRMNCSNGVDTKLKVFRNVQLLTSTTINNRSGLLISRWLMFTLLSSVQNAISSDKNLIPTTLETASTTRSVLLSFQE